MYEKILNFTRDGGTYKLQNWGYFSVSRLSRIETTYKGLGNGVLSYITDGVRAVGAFWKTSW